MPRMKWKWTASKYARARNEIVPNYSRMYGRCSTSKQHLSPEYQQQCCEKYHASNERLPALIGEMYMDKAQSGGVPLADRPAGRRLLLDLKRGDHLIVTAYDRLGRDIVDMLSTLRLLHKRGVFVHMLDLLFIANMDPDEPMTEIYLSQFAQFAQLEKRRIGVRTKQALDAKKAMGYVTTNGGVGPGWKAVPNPEWRTDLPKDKQKTIGRRLLVRDPDSADYFDQAYKMWFGGEKLPTIIRHLRNHADAASWTDKRLRYHLHKERDRRHQEHQRQQRNYIFGGGQSEG